jgi:hypothetical protein
MSCCFGGGQKRYQETSAVESLSLGSTRESIKLAGLHKEGKGSGGAAENRERPQRNSWLQIDDKGELIPQEVAFIIAVALVFCKNSIPELFTHGPGGCSEAKGVRLWVQS